MYLNSRFCSFVMADDGNAAPSDKGAADGLTRNASRTDADADGWISVQRRGKRAM